VLYCINYKCPNRPNSDHWDYCQSCGTTLLIEGRYRLIQPLRPLDDYTSTEIFEVTDGENRKVRKILKDTRPHLVEFFEREAMTLQLLNHPGIPKVAADGYFTFTPHQSKQELHCLVMEKIAGQNLEQWLAEHGAISESLALNWLRQLSQILQVLHEHHFFHRDIKPSNIIRKPDGQLVLIDFGSVRAIQETYLAKVNIGHVTTIISGGYTPLEQIEGKAVPQSDFYALGRTFVHLLTNKHPSDLPTDSHTGKLIWHKQAPQVSKPLADFIDEMMSPFSGDRPQNAGEVLRYLTVSGLLIKSLIRLISSPKFKIIIGLLTLGIAGTGVFFFVVLPVQNQLEAQSRSIRGRKALMDGNLTPARENFERAVSLAPKNALFRNDLGLVCKLQKDFECALQQYRQALRLETSEEEIATIYYNLGVLYDDINKFDDAIEEYQKAMGNNGELGINAINRFARLQIWQKQNNQIAIALLSKAIKQTKTPRLKSVLLKNLGWAYLQIGNYQNAEKSLQEAISLDQDRRAASRCLLAKIQQESDSTAALASWQKCRDFDSENLPEVKTWQLDAHRYLNTGGKDHEK